MVHGAHCIVCATGISSIDTAVPEFVSCEPLRGECLMTRVREFVSVCAFSVAIAIAAAGCHKKVAPPAPAPPPAPQALTEDQIFAQKSLAQLNAERPLADVYFDLDESTIRDDAKGPLQRNADFMKRWTSTQVSLEGHADERGSAEYNLGLGSRRADAVKQYLVSLGVGGNRIIVVSKGKEQPVCADHNETCWQQNRRDHFVITA